MVGNPGVAEFDPGTPTGLCKAYSLPNVPPPLNASVLQLPPRGLPPGNVSSVAGNVSSVAMRMLAPQYFAGTEFWIW